MNDFTIEGRPQPRPGDPTWNAGHVTVTPGYFETMRVPLIEGRFIDTSDAPDGPRVAVINEKPRGATGPARARSAGACAMDRMNPALFPWITIVGVVGNTRANGALAEQPPQIFFRMRT